MAQAKLTVVILFGGNSYEHVVSCDSARAVSARLCEYGYDLRLVGIAKSGQWCRQEYQQLQQQVQVDERQPLHTSIYPDTDNFLAELDLTGRSKSEIVIFPVLHGNNGEDGRMQGLLELAGFPYIGASLLGSALANDKVVAKELVHSAGLPVVPSVSFLYPNWQHDLGQHNRGAYQQHIADRLSYPLYVKPATAGSSIGIKKIATAAELDEAVRYAANYSVKILVEQAVDAQEIECAVIGDLAPVAAPMLGEISPLTGFYDYHAKYIDASTVEVVVPARIETALADKVRKAAVRIFRCLQLHGLA
ncbi:MAG: D-alanine--D-alanine ligase, partial [Pseudomonadota bacterium]|nr:D-alanine--D-alanine ligase [Pseudomonadota bacterium]